MNDCCGLKREEVRHGFIPRQFDQVAHLMWPVRNLVAIRNGKPQSGVTLATIFFPSLRPASLPLRLLVLPLIVFLFLCPARLFFFACWRCSFVSRVSLFLQCSQSTLVTSLSVLVSSMSALQSPFVCAAPFPILGSGLHVM